MGTRVARIHNVGQNLNTGGRMTEKIIHTQRVVCDLADSPYFTTYYMILQLEEAVRQARTELLMGDSPYISLLNIAKLADDARNEWHKKKEQLDRDEDNPD